MAQWQSLVEIKSFDLNESFESQRHIFFRDLYTMGCSESHQKDIHEILADQNALLLLEVEYIRIRENMLGEEHYAFKDIKHDNYLGRGKVISNRI
jgi:hypothetical protein